MNKDGSTPLHYAVRNCHTRTVELLLAKGASIEATGSGAETPLHLAARNGHTRMVELRLKLGIYTTMFHYTLQRGAVILL